MNSVLVFKDMCAAMAAGRCARDEKNRYGACNCMHECLQQNTTPVPNMHQEHTGSSLGLRAPEVGLEQQFGQGML
jgi:hypothetical protein